MKVLEQPAEEKHIKLDLKDKKILIMLAKNARTPATAIAKHVGLSRDAVSYRIKSLEKRQVLQGYRALVDINKLGYQVYHLFLQLTPPSEEVENELVEKFKAYPFVRAVLKFSDKYDYELALIARNIQELDKNLGKVISECGKFLHNYELLIITDFYVEKTFPLNFLETKEEPIIATKEKSKPEEAFKLDKKDIEILRMLANNASKTLFSVANKIGLSADAVNYRLKKMTAAGIIKKFVPVINYAPLGYGIYTILMNIRSLTDKNEAKLKEILMTDKNILWAVKTIGKYNVLMYVCATGIEDFHKTLVNLRSSFLEELKSYETLIAYQEYKYTYFPDGIEI